MISRAWRWWILELRRSCPVTRL